MIVDVAFMVINALLVLLLAPLIEGLMRKAVARLQGRVGAPITQPYRDLVKLLSRTRVTRPEVTWEGLYSFAPIAVLSVILVAASLVPTVAARPLGLADLILVFYLMALARFVLSVASFNTSNPFAVVGAAREHMLALGVEPAALLAAIVAALATSSSSLSGIALEAPKALSAGHWSYLPALMAFVAAIIADLAVPPFDIGEAEQEISEALLAEYGGPGLALLKLAVACKRLVMLNVLFALFIPFGMAWELAPLDLVVGVLSYLLKILAASLALAVMVVCAARMRVHDVLGYLVYSLALSVVAGVTYVMVG